ncbi:MAG TPA: hemerythrin domain-containing protein [Candidatus Limnocylindria bacterium]|nr:hemerythrin domain-containing protein [Candidatus Limnocylindria bacterium]
MPELRHFRAEHRHLIPHIDELRVLADGLEGSLTGAQLEALAKNEGWLREHLVPHAEAEDKVLYPAVAPLVGEKRATATMTFDHVEVGKLVAELQKAHARSDLREVRRLLYTLHALIAAHFRKEEEIFLPLLESALSEEDADELEERMERAADEAHEPAHA